MTTPDTTPTPIIYRDITGATYIPTMDDGNIAGLTVDTSEGVAFVSATMIHRVAITLLRLGDNSFGANTQARTRVLDALWAMKENGS